MVGKKEPDSIIFGKWQMSASENFEAFMSSLGVSYVVRKLGNQSKPLVTVSKDGDTLSFKQESLVSTSITTFKINEPFDEKTADGRLVRLIFLFPIKCSHFVIMFL